MPDRIYTFQQRLEIQVMERWVDLALSSRESEAMKEGFTALQLIIEDDPGMDPALKPKAYFNGNTVFDDRVSVPAVLLWITRLHRFIDNQVKGTLAR